MVVMRQLKMIVVHVVVRIILMKVVFFQMARVIVMDLLMIAQVNVVDHLC
jgi:hypothetical protein